MSRVITPLALALALVFASVGSVEARPPRNPNVGHRHDPGHFFMRLSAGFGYESAAFDDPGDTQLSGFGGMGSFKFGATIAQNLALGLDLFGMTMFEPSVEQNGQDLGDASNTRASFFGFGLGTTFYVMPVNIYFAGSLGAGIGSISFRDRIGGVTVTAEEDTKLGFALNLMIGKEWWVARRWGIGVAAQLIFSSLETDQDVGLGVLGIGLLFSATLN